MSPRLRHPLVAVAFVVLLTIPWVLLFAPQRLGVDLFGSVESLSTLTVVAISGIAVLGASFLLAWGAETAEKDVPRAFAIAVLAVLAVAPEYAVDALYAWGAGSGGATAEACAQFTAAQIESGVTPLAEACHDANLAVANMTGANRILIGLGWSAIAMFTVLNARNTNDPAVERRSGWLSSVVRLDRDIGVEVTFLFAATLWAFLVPFNGGIDALDMIALVGIYLAYIAVIVRGDVEEHDAQGGVVAYFQALRRPLRITAIVTLFVYSGVMIFTAVEPFAHGLEDLGTAAGVPSFFMIQWIAPLASESPELIVVAYLVNKARSTAGFNALISSKLNQWTLLIGTLVVVYSIALGSYGALPFDGKQAAEIWITAAQSFFALAILVNLEISIREAVVLLVLFLSQVFIEFAIVRDLVALPVSSIDVLFGFTAVYLALGFALFARRREAFGTLLGRTATTVRDAFGSDEPLPEQAD